MFGESLGSPVGLIDEKPAGNATVIFDGFEDLLLALFAHARERSQFAFLGKFLDPGQVTDLKCAPDQGDGLSDQALESSTIQAWTADISSAVPG